MGLSETLARRKAANTMAAALRPIPPDKAPPASLTLALARRGGRIKEDGRKAVQWSRDLDRILHLPWKDPSYPDLTKELRRPGGTMDLRPIQSAALWEGYQAKGLVSFMRAGDGKSGTALLLPTIMNVQRAVILTRSQLLSQMYEHDIPMWTQNFHVRMHAINFMTFEELSDPSKNDKLDVIKPQVVIVDEAHRLRRGGTARWDRFARFARENPETYFCFLSATLGTSSIHDYANFLELALGELAPIPLHYPDRNQWARCLDPGKDTIPPGALRALCKDESEPVRVAYRRRLVGTRGVVVSENVQIIKAPIVIHERKVKGTAAITAMMDQTRKTWTRPDGEELEEILALHRVLLQESMGFYYIWDWGGKPEDTYWLEARKAWNRAVRVQLRNNSKKGMDSPKLLSLAAERIVCKSVKCTKKLKPTADAQCDTCGKPTSPQWFCPEWGRWRDVKDRSSPKTLPQWVDSTLIEDAIKWGHEHQGIIWYRHTVVGEAVAKFGGFPLYGGGDEASQGIALENKRRPVRTIVASMNSHDEGKNLEGWSKNLFLEFPGNASKIEQLLARTHRPGQLADKVEFWLYRHTPELITVFETCLAQARFLEETIGMLQRITQARKLFHVSGNFQPELLEALKHGGEL